MIKYFLFALALFVVEGPKGPNAIPPSVQGPNGPKHQKYIEAIN